MNIFQSSSRSWDSCGTTLTTTVATSVVTTSSTRIGHGSPTIAASVVVDVFVTIFAGSGIGDQLAFADGVVGC